MPNKIYSVQLGDKIYDIEGDRPPTKEEVEALVGKQAPVSKLGKIEQDIKSRGNVLDVLRGAKQKISKPGALNKTLGVLEAASVPSRMVESAISSAPAAIQRGVVNPLELASESVKGATGQKLTEFGDVFRGAGASEPVSASVGFAASMLLPSVAIGNTMKQMAGLSKMKDRGLKLAGNRIITAIDRAEKSLGNEIDNAFKPIASSPVDSATANQVLESVTKLPDELVSVIEQEVGDLPTLLQNLNHENLRKIIRTIGKYSPGVFGREERGLLENINADKIVKSYGKLKRVLKSSVSKQFGNDAAEALMSAEEKFGRVKNAGNRIKTKVIDPYLKLPTKAGELADELKKDTDFALRSAFTTIRKAGPEAKRDIEGALENISKFRRYMTAKKIGISAAKAAFFGGAIGAAGGAAARKIGGQE